MRFSFPIRLYRYIGLIVVTLFAAAAMIASGASGWRWFGNEGDGNERTLVVAETKLTPAPVEVLRLQPDRVRIYDEYSGMIRPFRRYSLAMLIGGRIEALGRKDGAAPVIGLPLEELDAGDRISINQVLAVLDRRALKAKLDEASARYKRAANDLERARLLRSNNAQAIAAAEFEIRVTDVEIAKAQRELAQRKYDDAELFSPVDGVIAQRFANSGESIISNQAIFEVVEIDRVLLVVGVPESRIMELERRRREVTEAREELQRNEALGRPSELGHELPQFTVEVELLGRDRFGQQYDSLEGEVYRIAETADDTTGLFEVEVILNNSHGLLKPGLIARARIVIDEIDAFSVPTASVVFRGDQALLFVVDELDPTVEAIDGLGPVQKQYVARGVALDEWVEQGDALIIPVLQPGDRTAVVRGQHRLVDGRTLELVSSNGSGSGTELEDCVGPIVGSRE